MKQHDKIIATTDYPCGSTIKEHDVVTIVAISEEHNYISVRDKYGEYWYVLKNHFKLIEKQEEKYDHSLLQQNANEVDYEFKDSRGVKSETKY